MVLERGGAVCWAERGVSGATVEPWDSCSKGRLRLADIAARERRAGGSQEATATGASANGGIVLSCIVDGKTVLSFAKGKLVSGDKALYTSKPKGLFVGLGTVLVRLINFEAVHRSSGALLPGDVTCAMYTDKGRTEFVVYNQLFASKDEAAQAVSRSSVVARAAIMEHVYDRENANQIKSNANQVKGIAVDTEIRVPQNAFEAADGGVDPSLAAFLFFTVLPLLATNQDAFYTQTSVAAG